MNWKVHVTSNFNFVIKTEGLLKVTGNLVHCRCHNISVMVQDDIIITTDH